MGAISRVSFWIREDAASVDASADAIVVVVAIVVAAIAVAGEIVVDERRVCSMIAFD
jgi:hypothetical protein